MAEEPTGLRLGDKIADWIGSIPPFSWVSYWFPGLAARFREASALLRDYEFQKIPVYRLDITIALLLYAIVFTLTGWEIPHPSPETAQTGPNPTDISGFTDDPQKWMFEHLKDFGESPETKAFAEFVGTIITEPVVSLLETYAGDDNPDPHAMARAFHGIASGLPFAAQTVDNLLTIPLGDRAPKLGNSIMALYWGLGLGFLGWQTLAPLLSAGLQPNLERYYNKLYRPARFNPGQARDIFALGLWDANQMQAYLTELGWRDQDIELWLQVSYRDLSEGHVWDLFQTGKLSQSETEKRLRKLGYNPDDIPLLFLLNGKADESDAPKFLVSTAKAALKAKQISTEEFRTILRGLNYAEREIEMQVQLITAQKNQEDRELTTAQIKSLYEARIIGRDEVIKNLIDIEYNSTVAEQLLQAWDNEALPKAARINRGTIIEGYVNGALSRSEVLSLLAKECGYSTQNAELIVKIEEASVKKSQSLIGISGPAISLDLLTQLAQNGLITRAQVETRSELSRFTPEDKKRLISLMFAVPAESPVALSPELLIEAFHQGIFSQDVLNSKLLGLGMLQTDIDILLAANRVQLAPSLISQAYVFGAIDRTDFASRLRGSGLSDADIELFIRTVELGNPDVFGEFTKAFLKRASVGSLQLAMQRGLIDEVTFRARLAEQGYNQDAIEIHVFNAQYQAPASPKTLSKADILSLYRSDKLTRSQSLQRLIQIGYTIDDASLLIEGEEKSIADTEIGQAYIAGYLNEFGAASALTEQGYTLEEIDQFFIDVANGSI